MERVSGQQVGEVVGGSHAGVIQEEEEELELELESELELEEEEAEEEKSAWSSEIRVVGSGLGRS